MRGGCIIFIIGCVLAQAATAGPATTQAVCELVITSVKVEPVKLRITPAEAGADSALFAGLRDAQGGKGQERDSDEEMLVVRIKLKNASRQQLTYRTFNGTDPQCKSFAKLVDAKRTPYAIAHFGGAEVVGAIHEPKKLAHGESVDDVLVFEVPPASAKALKLVLPVENLDGRRLQPVPIEIEPKR